MKYAFYLFLILQTSPLCCMEETKRILNTCTILDYHDTQNLISYLQDLSSVFGCLTKTKTSSAYSSLLFSSLTTFINNLMKNNLGKDPFIERFGYSSFSARDYDAGILHRGDIDFFHPRVQKLLPYVSQKVLQTCQAAYLNEQKKEWATLSLPEKKEITLAIVSKCTPDLKETFSRHHTEIKNIITLLHARLAEWCSSWANPKLLWEPFPL